MTDPLPVPPRTSKVLIIDDHPIFRLGISRVIDVEPDLEVCGEAGSARTALETMRRLQPDVALVDISMPGTNGIDLVKSMKAEMPKLPILVLSMHDESIYAIRALRAGALGYLMKADALDSVIEAIRRILSGDPYLSFKMANRLIMRAVQTVGGGMGSPVDVLSDRELEVLTLIGRGLSTIDIAEELHLSGKTVESHRSHIREKLDLKDSKELVRFAIEWARKEI